MITQCLNQKSGLVYLLWGKYAQMKGKVIDKSRAHLLEASHPSPLSADKGFFGCKAFSKCNALLIKQGMEPIDWSL